MTPLEYSGTERLATASISRQVAKSHRQKKAAPFPRLPQLIRCRLVAAVAAVPHTVAIPAFTPDILPMDPAMMVAPVTRHPHHPVAVVMIVRTVRVIRPVPEFDAKVLRLCGCNTR